MSASPQPTWPALITDNAGYRPAFRATAWTPASGVTLDVPITDGWVLKDAGQYPRTHVQVTCADTTIGPRVPSDLLQPTGAFLKIEYGYTVSGTTTWATLADGPITRVEADRPNGQLVVESSDLSAFLAAYDMWDGTALPTFADGYDLMVNLIIGFATAYGWGGPAIPGWTGATVFAGPPAYQSVRSPAYTVQRVSAWEVVEDLADMLGVDVYFNAARQLAFRARSSTPGTPAFTFAVGRLGTITEYVSDYQRVPNGVTLVYNDGARVGTWTDTDPNSPTLYGGTYGRYRVTEDRTGLPAQAEADNAARDYARRLRGDGRTYTIRSVPVPWLEPGDTVAVQPLGNITEYHTVQSVSIPLALDVMTTTTRNPNYTSVI